VSAQGNAVISSMDVQGEYTASDNLKAGVPYTVSAQQVDGNGYFLAAKEAQRLHQEAQHDHRVGPDSSVIQPVQGGSSHPATVPPAHQAKVQNQKLFVTNATAPLASANPDPHRHHLASAHGRNHRLLGTHHSKHSHVAPLKHGQVHHEIASQKVPDPEHHQGGRAMDDKLAAAQPAGDSAAKAAVKEIKIENVKAATLMQRTSSFSL
jgi:hypothetical protein